MRRYLYRDRRSSVQFANPFFHHLAADKSGFGFKVWGQNRRQNRVLHFQLCTHLMFNLHFHLHFLAVSFVCFV